MTREERAYAMIAWNQAVKSRRKWLSVTERSAVPEFLDMEAAFRAARLYGLATPYQVAGGGTA